MQSILEDRAAKLAIKPQEDAQEDTLSLLEFALGEQRYAIDLLLGKEVTSLGELTPLEQTPTYLAGVTNYRRQVVPVFDLKNILGISESQHERFLLLIEQEGIEIAILTNAVIGTRTVSKDALKEPIAGFEGLKRQLLLGILEDHTIVIDAKVLFTHEELSVGEKERK